MDIQTIVTAFELFTGEENGDDYYQLILLAVSEVQRILLPDADTTEVRLSFLCAALAFYRLQQILAARERAAFTYAGKVLKESQNTAYEYAKELLRDYLQIAADLISSKKFIFSSFAGGEELISC
ncbi:hypothetical protein [Ruminococcus flavefaciens]|uniref:hypothetical protein n=1 Tax=Ruminococcus flavefaciens TaxID=1265 RepID=UPI0026E9DD9E|nr:hypothetical protein [Ruminococcus flavefaciens]